jgi:hypothetical protein
MSAAKGYRALGKGNDKGSVFSSVSATLFAAIITGVVGYVFSFAAERKNAISSINRLRGYTVHFMHLVAQTMLLGASSSK